ncbi:MAG: hypothetical protein KatS3mg035_2186 [Bacteroidia bacterium]|nr:MAG: hypothetical protein KatS3mg035_2186 [Bacteroidia bacterium]
MKQIKQAIIVICFITLFSSCGHHFYILGKVNQINDDKQKNGLWIEQNDTLMHIIEIVKYKNGVRNGNYKSINTIDQSIVKGKYVNGKKHGIWKMYSQSGTLLRYNIYKNDTIFKIRRYVHINSSL